MDRPLSYSRISSFTYNCPFAYYLRYIALVSTGRTSLTRLWGMAIHKAIEEHHLFPDPAISLIARIHAEFINQLRPYGLDTMAAEALALLPTIEALHNDLSEKSKTPWNLKAWKDSKEVSEFNTLEASMTDLAATRESELKYNKSEGITHKLRKNASIAEMYLAFDQLYPLMKKDDGTPLIEIRLTQEFNGRPMVTIIDQIRSWPTGDFAGQAFPVDLKSNMDAPHEALINTNYQLTNAQLLMMLSDELPDPAGAMWYQLRTGTPYPLPPTSTELAEEWAQTIEMVMRAEEHGIFPRRRDGGCKDCDYYEDHCAQCVGPIGE